MLQNGKCKGVSCSAAKGERNIGFLGLGIMGKAMASNLIKDGYSVIVWNRDTQKMAPLLEAGALAAGSPKEAVEQSDITFAMLSDPSAAREVALGDHGVVAGISQGKGYIDVSTVDAKTAEEISQAVTKAGGAYLEAPVSGSKGPAEQGTLVFLTAGSKELYDSALPLLEVMGKKSYFLGKVGNGANMKLVVNMVMGSMMASFSEGLLLAEKAGLDPSDLVDVAAQGAIAAPMFAMKGPTMISKKFDPAFPLKHQQKDMRLALELGELVAQNELPVASAANDLYQKGIREGLGDEDFSAVVKALGG